MKVMHKVVLFFGLVICSLSFANSFTTKVDPFGNGSTTRFDDGTSAHTVEDPFGNGSTTTFSDGSRAHTRQDPFGNGSKTTFD